VALIRRAAIAVRDAMGGVDTAGSEAVEEVLVVLGGRCLDSVRGGNEPEEAVDTTFGCERAVGEVGDEVGRVGVRLGNEVTGADQFGERLVVGGESVAQERLGEAL
jgi:hypothetical protein